jgi:hypothetical protein
MVTTPMYLTDGSVEPNADMAEGISPRQGRRTRIGELKWGESSRYRASVVPFFVLKAVVPEAKNDALPVARSRFERPRGLTIIGILWGAEAIFNIIFSFYLYGPSTGVGALNNYAAIMAPEMTIQDVTLRIFFAFFAVVQLVTAYEIVRGGTWAYLGGLAVSAIDVAVFSEFVLMYYGAPLPLLFRMELRTPLLLEGLGVGIAFAALIWVYFNLPSNRRYLMRWF